MNIKDMYKAARAVGEIVIGREISDDEVDSRRDSCSDCDMLKVAETAKQKAACLIGGGEFVCGVCDCSIKLITQLKLESLHEDNKEESGLRPSSCWQK